MARTSLRDGPLPFVLTLTLSAAAAWIGLYLVAIAAFSGPLDPEWAPAAAKAIASSVAFLAYPVVVLRRAGRPVLTGRIDGTLLPGLLTYLLLMGGIIAAYPSNPGFFGTFDASGLLLFAVLVAPIVASVDFVTRRLVQEEVHRVHGARWGIIAGFVAWMAGHPLELVWLQPLLGVAGTVAFVAMSGAVTGLVYARWRNVLGLMLGHWAINVLTAVVTSRWNLLSGG